MNERIIASIDAFSAAELASEESRASATPMMEQYIEIKANNPGSLLFYRMGDFYELFFEDAVDASRALGITLTTRGQHMGQDIPMCGVPVHAADDYLQKLISLGFRVAVCEQVEDPAEAKKARGPFAPRSFTITKGSVAIYSWADILPGQNDLGCANVIRKHIEGIQLK